MCGVLVPVSSISVCVFGSLCRVHLPWTCPDYIKDYLPKIHQHTAYIGEKRPALEKTGDLRYLLRSAPDRSLPAKYKHEYVGGIGWGIPEYRFINRSRLGSGFHIKLGELSLYANDKVTHRYQNPWQPKPSVLDMQGRNSRAFLAWNMSDYEDSQQRDSQRAILLKQSKSPRPSLPSRLPKLPRKEEKGVACLHEILRCCCTSENRLTFKTKCGRSTPWGPGEEQRVLLCSSKRGHEGR
ncbi:protein SPMIP2 [Microtus pennsylvanicus]|uniref:protein SPMIP2 n=1 Tax=Microtus pennsylvanicus TaxID=10058 RepID=UPI003F6D2309